MVEQIMFFWSGAGDDCSFLCFVVYGQGMVMRKRFLFWMHMCFIGITYCHNFADSWGWDVVGIEL